MGGKGRRKGSMKSPPPPQTPSPHSVPKCLGIGGHLFSQLCPQNARYFMSTKTVPPPPPQDGHRAGQVGGGGVGGGGWTGVGEGGWMCLVGSFSAPEDFRRVIVYPCQNVSLTGHNC